MLVAKFQRTGYWARVVLILALLTGSWLGGGIKSASAEVIGAQLMDSFHKDNTSSNPDFTPLRAVSFAYSKDGVTVVTGATSLPPETVKWATVERYYRAGYSTDSYTYRYSQNGVVKTTTDVNQLPADARWVTISGFNLSGAPIVAQEYKYSVDGIDSTTGSEVPADAVWATLINFTNWGSKPFDQTTLPYSVDKNMLPRVIGTTIKSQASNPMYAKEGDVVELAFTMSKAVQSPDVRVNGLMASIDPDPIDPNKWTALRVVTSSMPEGIANFVIKATDLEGGVGVPYTSGADSGGNSVLIDKTKPIIALSAAPLTPTNGDVTITVAITETGSGTDTMKWASGNQNEAYFVTGGSAFSGSTFSVPTNGTYTVFAKDKAGNTAVQTTTVGNIDKDAPSITLSATPSTPTNADVTVTATITDTAAGIAEQKWAIGDRDAAYFATGGTSFAGSTFTVSANGTYTVFAKDTMGNTAVQTIMVGNIDKDAPMISLSATPSTPTNEDVTVTAKITDPVAGIAEKKWANGDHDAAYFATGGTSFIGSAFAVSANGTYTVFAKDKAGNTAVQTIMVGNIDKDGPSITLSATPSTPTNGAVTVTATIVDTATGIAEQKWASGNQDTAYFAANGTVLDKDTFIVTKNGTYTVYAKDQLGNETVQTIDVTTISNIPPSPNYPVPSPTYPVTGVSLNQSTVKLQEKGAPATLLATITPSYATLQQVTWSSSDEKVATVDQNGVVTPHAAGEAVITVKTIDGNFTAESKVTVQAVQAVTVTALELKDTSLLLKPGKSTRIKVYAVYSDGTKAEISRNKGTAYKTDSSLVTVGKGLIRTGKKEGEARVSIQFEGMTAELLVVVNKKQLEGIELPADSVTLEQGEEEQLHASARWSNKELDDVTDTALWFSSDDKIVSVEQGKIKAVEPGTATITVVYGDKKAAIEVEITEAKKIRRLTASKSSVSLKEGNRQKITLTAIFTDNTKSTVTEKAEWQSDDEEIAKVEAGVIKAVAPGTTTVTATYRGKVYKIKVNVKK